MARPVILDLAEAQGHVVFERGEYNLNIIGVRSPETESNAFDDRLHCVFKSHGAWVDICWRITTDPGTYWLNNPSNVNGTAILVPGQYRGVYKIDLHNGQYEALCQRLGPVTVWRDNNKDDVLDWDVDEDTGYFGINIHRSSTREGGSTQVDKWSAGCQVFADPDEFAIFMAIVKRAAVIWGDAFTYTLLDERLI